MGTFMEFIYGSPNNLSFWFPKVRDCGIRVPETHIIPVPKELIEAFFMEREGDRDLIRDFVRTQVMPVVEALPGPPFIKNGCYSDKFNFAHCCPPSKDEDTILRSIIDIQYGSLCNDTGGNGEIVIRKVIPSPTGLPSIYNGLPLNTEFRVFYDFDNRMALYVNPYWDREYCWDHFHDLDAAAFDRRWPAMSREYEACAEEILDLVDEAFFKVSGLKGIWSADILLDASGTPWLIDMAEGNRSVYWKAENAVLCILHDKMERYITEAETETGNERRARRWAYWHFRTHPDDMKYPALMETAFVKAWNGKNGTDFDVESLALSFTGSGKITAEVEDLVRRVSKGLKEYTVKRSKESDIRKFLLAVSAKAFFEKSN